MIQSDPFEIVFFLIYVTCLSTAAYKAFMNLKKKQILYKIDDKSLKWSQQPPILMQMHMPKSLIKGCIVYNLLAIVLYFFITSYIIEMEYSSSSESKETTVAYYDSLLSINFLLSNMFHIFLVLAIFLTIFVEITLNYCNNLLIALGFTILQLLFNVMRVNSQKCFIISLVLYIINDIVLGILIIYLLLISSRISVMKTSLSSLEDERLKKLYHDYTRKFSNYTEDELLQNTEKIISFYDTQFLIKQIRRISKSTLENGQTYLIYVFFPLLILIGFILIDEIRVQFSQAKPFFANNDIFSIKDNHYVQSYYDFQAIGNPLSASIRPNVMFVLCSGLGFSKFKTNQLVGSLLKKPDLKNDFQLFKLKTQIPSEGYNNWFSMFTGSKTELHGIYGNTIQINPPHYDSIFEQVHQKEEYIKSKVMGSEFFEKAIDLAMPTANVQLNNKYTKNSYQQANNIEKFKSHLQKMAAESQQEKKSNFYQQFLQKATSDYETLKKIKSIQNQDDFRALYSSLDQDFSEMKEIINNKTKIFNYNNDYHFHVLQLDSLDNVAYKQGINNNYNENLDEIIKLLEDIINSVDTNTVLIFTSDHGHQNPGGSGGTQPQESEIPLFVYQKNSKMSINSQNQDVDQAKRYEIIDIAPTLSALLGVPVPRNNQGKYIEELIPLVAKTDKEIDLIYKDLRNQKQRQTEFFYKKIKKSTNFSLDSQFNTKTSSQNNQFFRFFQNSQQPTVNNTMVSTKAVQNWINEPIMTKQFYSKQTDIIENFYEEEASQYKSKQFTKDFTLNFLFLLFYMILVLIIIDQFSFVDMGSLFGKRGNLSKKFNQKAFLIALTIVVIFYFFIFLLFLFWYMIIRQYNVWGYSIVSSPLSYPGFIFLNFFLQVLLGLFYIRLPLYIMAQWDPNNCLNRCLRRRTAQYYQNMQNNADKQEQRLLNFTRLLNPLEKIKLKSQGLAYIYLIRIYFLLMIFFIYLILLLVESQYRNFYLLLSNDISSFKNYNNYDNRFRTFSIMLMNFPLFIAALYSLNLNIHSSIENDKNDPIFLLNQYKKQRKCQNQDKNATNQELELLLSKMAGFQLKDLELHYINKGQENVQELTDMDESIGDFEGEASNTEEEHQNLIETQQEKKQMFTDERKQQKMLVGEEIKISQDQIKQIVEDTQKISQRHTHTKRSAFLQKVERDPGEGEENKESDSENQ